MKIDIPDKMLQQIGNLLSEHPFKVVAPIMQHLQEQVTANEQQARMGKPASNVPPLDITKSNGNGAELPQE